MNLKSSETLHFPPPWNLHGEGFILPFLADKNKILEKGFMNEDEKKSFRGGLGACMFVNYETSNVGPYFELLFIPGDFEFKNKHGKSKLFKRITKIYVSSKMSIQEGRLNWAIPKEYADFKWDKDGNHTKIKITSESGEIFLEAEFIKKYFSFPLTTTFYPVSLLQSNDSGNLINTQFKGKGKGKFASKVKWEVNEKFFVDIDSVSKYNLSLSADNFKIVFPIPEIF